MNFNILTEKEVTLTNKEVLPNSLIMGDCLEVMKHIPDGSVDLILTDPPYGFRDKRYPKNLLVFSNASQKNRFHPTQKPVALLEYLIKTYTLEGETVLDFTAGSGSAGVAALNTNRRFIDIELDEGYFEIAKERIEGVNDVRTH